MIVIELCVGGEVRATRADIAVVRQLRQRAAHTKGWTFPTLVWWPFAIRRPDQGNIRFLPRRSGHRPSALPLLS